MESNRPKMAVSDRAKQFAPFAALKGFEEALAAKEKIIVDKPSLSEDALSEMDETMKILTPGMLVHAIYYSKNEYIKISGMVAKIETTSRILQIVNTRISFDDILKIEIE